MEKLNLNTITTEYYNNRNLLAKQRAIELVEKEIVPMLVNAAKAGQRQCRVVINATDVYVTDVQEELHKRVHCKMTGYGKTFSVKW